MNQLAETITRELTMAPTGEVLVDSLKFARHFDKEHKAVLRAIRAIAADDSEFHGCNFAPMIRTVKVGKGAIRQETVMTMTEDGFWLLTNRLTGPKAARLQIAFIHAFKELRRRFSATLDAWNAKHYEVAVKKDRISQCGREMRRWQDEAPLLYQQLEALHPQMRLALPPAA